MAMMYIAEAGMSIIRLIMMRIYLNLRYFEMMMEV